MRRYQLLQLLSAWSSEQPTACRFFRNEPNQSFWQIKLKHLKYQETEPGEAWVSVADECGRLCSIESFLIVATAIQVAKPRCLNAFLKLSAPMQERVTFLIAGDEIASDGEEA